MNGTSDEKKQLITQLRRIEGQIRGIQNMIEEDRYCIDVLTQIQAVRASITNVGYKVLEGHAKGCVVNAIQHGNTDIIEEMLEVVKKFTK